MLLPRTLPASTGPLVMTWLLAPHGLSSGASTSRGVTELRFRDSVVYWHLSTFPSRAEAEASRSAAGVVVEEAGKQPGQRSIVHTHPGPEGWYMLAGEQCLETSVGVFRGGTGQTVVAPANVPMELTITGNQLRQSLLVVIHDARESRGKRREWQPTGACSG
jgi:quercetin dioxygenase-like cupin family protein